MAYLNNIYGNAAYTGFLAALLTDRGIAGLTTANLNTLKATALAYAVAIDAKIAFDASVTKTATITQLTPYNALLTAIAGTVIVPGDGGLAIQAAVALTVAPATIAATEQWKGHLLHDLCKNSLNGSFTTSVTVQSGAAVSALLDSVAAAFANFAAGLVLP